MPRWTCRPSWPTCSGARAAAARPGRRSSEALRLAGPGNTVRRAHLHTRLGRLEMADLRYRGRRGGLRRRRGAARPGPWPAGRGQDPGTVGEWLEMMVDGRAGLYTMRNEPERALAVLDAVRPVLEASGNPARKYSFYMHLALSRVMRNRYRVDEADIAIMRAGPGRGGPGGRGEGRRLRHVLPRPLLVAARRPGSGPGTDGAGPGHGRAHRREHPARAEPAGARPDRAAPPRDRAPFAP